VARRRLSPDQQQQEDEEEVVCLPGPVQRRGAADGPGLPSRLPRRVHRGVEGVVRRQGLEVGLARMQAGLARCGGFRGAVTHADCCLQWVTGCVNGCVALASSSVCSFGLRT
jgi:hypothetical protein